MRLRVALAAVVLLLVCRDSAQAAKHARREPGNPDLVFRRISAATAGSSERREDKKEKETVAARVAELQGMSDSDVKFELLSLYSASKPTEEMILFPHGSIESVQRVLERLLPVDEEARDVVQFMQRWALAVAQATRKYKAFYDIKVQLGEPSLSPQTYMLLRRALVEGAKVWQEASDLLIAYLTRGMRDLEEKWGMEATTNKRLRDVLAFIEKLIDVYEAQRHTFDTGLRLAEMRYMRHKDRMADLTQLLYEKDYSMVQSQYEEALEDLKDKNHACRKLAKAPIEEGLVYEEFLDVLPFGRDLEREQAEAENNEYH